MFHRHHPHDEPERAQAQVPIQPAEAEGAVLDWAPSSLYRTRQRLLVGVKFDDGQKVVCYDPADRSRMWIDVAAVNDAATRRHQELGQERRSCADALLDASDPVHPVTGDEPGR